MDSATKRIVVLGGGYAGIAACKVLEKSFRKDASVEITLVDRNAWHTLMTELHETAGSRTGPEAVRISFARIFSGTRVKVARDNILGIDFQTRELRSATKTYPYDHLVIGTGGKPEFFGVPGVQDNSCTLWSYEDAMRLRTRFETCFEEAAGLSDAGERRKRLSFTIAGAGFTGIELAGEFMERSRILCREWHIDPSDVSILVVEAKDDILPILPPKPRAAARRYLERKGVEIRVNAAIVGAEPGKILLADGSFIETGTFVWTCGIHASEFTARIMLTKGRVSTDSTVRITDDGIHGLSGCHDDSDCIGNVGKRGRITVDEFMRSVDYPEVSLCGDVVWHLQDGAPLPQIVETALQTGETAAHNVAASIKGKPMKPLRAAYHGFMVSIGGKYAVAHVMGFSLYGIFAMAMKHLVNLHYLWGVAGINSCWGYLKEEFLDIKDRRTVIGGHLAAKIPAYWALPARLWLGLMWFIEGLNKIGEGWFDFTRGSQSGWMFSKGVMQAGAALPHPAKAVQDVSDAVAAASEGASEGADTVVAGVAAAVQGAADTVAAASDAVGDAAAAVATTGAHVVNAVATPEKWGWDLSASILPRDFVLVTWFRETFMDGIFAHLPFQFFQVMIVSMEMLVGLAIFGGLFTMPAAVVSIGLCMVFTLSGMFSWTQLWFVFLAILMFGGAGQVAGLDYWAMPLLRKGWNSLGFVRRTHLYVGEPNIRKNRKQGRA